jgi:hypothetical protein
VGFALTPSQNPPPSAPPPGDLEPISVNGFLDEGPVYAQGSMLEQWATTLPPDIPFPFLRELWYVNQTRFGNATQVFTAFDITVAGLPSVFAYSSNYSGIIVAEPPASTFAVGGLEHCPMAFACDAAAAGAAATSDAALNARLASRAATAQRRLLEAGSAAQ